MGDLFCSVAHNMYSAVAHCVKASKIANHLRLLESKCDIYFHRANGVLESKECAIAFLYTNSPPISPVFRLVRRCSCQMYALDFEKMYYFATYESFFYNTSNPYRCVLVFKCMCPIKKLRAIKVPHCHRLFSREKKTKFHGEHVWMRTIKTTLKNQYCSMHAIIACWHLCESLEIS